jgi:hypothetical protein
MDARLRCCFCVLWSVYSKLECAVHVHWRRRQRMPRLKALQSAAIEAVNSFQTPDRFRLRDTGPESSKITNRQGRHSRHEVNADLIFAASFSEMQASPKLSPIQPALFLFWVPDLHHGLGRISSLVRGQNIASHDALCCLVARYRCPAGVVIPACTLGMSS